MELSFAGSQLQQLGLKFPGSNDTSAHKESELCMLATHNLTFDTFRGKVSLHSMSSQCKVLNFCHAWGLCVCACTCVMDTHVEIRGQLSGINSPIPLWSPGINSDNFKLATQGFFLIY